MKVDKCKKGAMKFWGNESQIQIENYMKSISPQKNSISKGFSSVFNVVKRFFGFKDDRQKAKDALAHDIERFLIGHSSPYTNKEYQKIAESALLSLTDTKSEKKDVDSCFPETVKNTFDESAPRELRIANKAALHSFLQTIIPNKTLHIPDPRPLSPEEQYQIDSNSIKACGPNASKWLEQINTRRTSKKRARTAAALLDSSYTPEELENTCKINMERSDIPLERRDILDLKFRMDIERKKKNGTYGVRRVDIADWVPSIGTNAVKWAEILTVQGGLIRKRIPKLQDLQKKYSNEEIDTACKDLVMQNKCHLDLEKRLQDNSKLMKKSRNGNRH
ncbi:MAG: hypothetical protein ACI9S8_002955 [Chlamydiales bacterium]|jgi:hypothetical protein